MFPKKEKEMRYKYIGNLLLPVGNVASIQDERRE